MASIRSHHPYRNIRTELTEYHSLWVSGRISRGNLVVQFDIGVKRVAETKEQSILVVDDNPDHRKMFRSRLESGGYSVVEASSGKEALAAIEKTRFALMILDLSMPDMDGFDVLRAVRSTRRDLMIIVVSGLMHGKPLDSAGILGADATLDKDQTSDLLLPMVRDLLENPK